MLVGKKRLILLKEVLNPLSTFMFYTTYACDIFIITVLTSLKALINLFIHDCVSTNATSRSKLSCERRMLTLLPMELS
jgi:hypothetical protein